MEIVCIFMNETFERDLGNEIIEGEAREHAEVLNLLGEGGVYDVSNVLRAIEKHGVTGCQVLNERLKFNKQSWSAEGVAAVADAVCSNGWPPVLVTIVKDTEHPKVFNKRVFDTLVESGDLAVCVSNLDKFDLSEFDASDREHYEQAAERAKQAA